MTEGLDLALRIVMNARSRAIDRATVAAIMLGVGVVVIEDTDHFQTMPDRRIASGEVAYFPDQRAFELWCERV